MHRPVRAIRRHRYPMARYYLRLFGRIPSIFRQRTEAWKFWLGVALGFVGLVWPDFAEKVVGLESRWWVLVPAGLLVIWGLLKANYDELERASHPGEPIAFEPPLYNVPRGSYTYKLQKEQREHYERLKVENTALKRQLGLPH